MPMYDFECSSGHRFERMVPLANFEDAQDCACGEPARRLISRPMIAVEQVDYTCPVTGAWIGSKRAHEDNLRRHDCRVLETGEKEAAAKFRAEAEAAFDRAIDRTVEREIDLMPSAKKESLYNELTRQGLDVSVDRQTPA